MPDIVITDLDNLPTGVSLVVGDELTRLGNAITWDNVRDGWSLEYFNPDAPFHVGEKVQIAFQVENWTWRFIRVYGRGFNTYRNFLPGYWKWSIVSGMSPNRYLEDANENVRTDQNNTVVLEMTCYQETYGWGFRFASVGYDWGTASGTGTTRFLYATTNFNFPDPYNPVGPSGPGGGGSQYDPYSTDDIGFNDLPQLSAIGTGFVSLWSPDEQQMLNLSAFMWNANPLTIEFWRKLIADPMQLVYGLNIIPLDLETMGLIGGTDNVVVGLINTGITMNYLNSQWVELDCGTIDIDEALLGSYMDYDPYTKLDIYLPYIGYRALKVDDFMPGTMTIKYKIDLLTGSCVAQIKSTKDDTHNDELDSVVYQFMGNCATQIPVTATQYADAVRSAISTAAAIGTVALLAGTGGAGAAAAGGSLAVYPSSAGFGEASTALAPISEGVSRLPIVLGEPKSVTASLMDVGKVHAGAAAIENVMGTKPSVQRSGAIGGSGGLLSTQKPYIVFTRPRVAHPEDQNKYTGYPSFMTTELYKLHGFTQIQEIHLESLPCTAGEQAEIEALLKSGVIF